MRIFNKATEITSKIERLDVSYATVSYVIGDFIYIASDLPFNHIFVKLGSVKNLISATMKVEYYSNKWEEVKELRDETLAFSNDGFIEFTPDIKNGWGRVAESDDLDLSLPVVYYKYWTRISFDVMLTQSIAISFIGNKFSDDSDLFMEYPIFDDTGFMTAFKPGKTSWEEQHIRASQLIIDDLIKKNVIIAREQILDRKKFIGASICKAAELIYSAFGNDYTEQRKSAREEYIARIDLSQYNVDTNSDAILDGKETIAKQGWLGS